MSKREKHENVKYAKCARMQNLRDMRVRELRSVWDREMCIIREMRKNARNLKHEMRERCENTRCAKYVKYEMCENARCAEAPKRENAKTAKIAKVATLQQVQYKVLLYGLYAPIET
jgi:hypothetical protein